MSKTYFLLIINSNMVAEMYELNQRVGYHLLFFLSEADAMQSSSSSSSSADGLSSSDTPANSKLIGTGADFNSKQVLRSFSSI